MQIKKTMLTITFLIGLLAGCASTSSINTHTDKLQKVNDIQMVSVSSFTCSDPVIADNVRNVIIESLLAHYSVVIGAEADFVVKGAITLFGNQVSRTSPKTAKGHVSEISAQIIKDNKILDSAIVTQVITDSSTPDTPEVMGSRMGEKIKEIISDIQSSTTQ